MPNARWRCRSLAAALSLGLCAINIWFVVSPVTRGATPVRRERAWLKSAMPMSSSEFIRVLDGQYAMILFGALASVEDVGLFRVALSIAGFLGLSSTLVNLAVMPFLAHLYAGNDLRRLQLATNGAALAIFGTTFVMTLALIMAGEWPVTLAFGKAYAGSWVPLALIACAYTVNGFYGSAPILLNMSGQERAVARAFAFGLIVGSDADGRSLSLVWH